MGITGLSHFYFETKNYQESKKFWEALGFKNTLDLSQSGEGGGLYSNENLTLMVREVSAQPVEEIYFEMRDPAATVQRLKSEGVVKITKDLFESHWDTQLVQIQDPDGRKFYLEAGHEKYEKPKLEMAKMIVNLVVMSETKTLLVKYKDVPDHQKGWFVPHEFLARGEDPAKICGRIAKEQVGFNLAPEMKPKLNQIQSFIGGDGSWHLSYDYSLHLTDEFVSKKGVGVSEAEWFPLSKLPARNEVAHHGWALDIVQSVLT